MSECSRNNCLLDLQQTINHILEIQKHAIEIDVHVHVRTNKQIHQHDSAHIGTCKNLISLQNVHAVKLKTTERRQSIH